MHGSLTALGGLVPMFLIQLGEILPGGVGSGALRHAGLRHPRGLRRRPDGRAHAGIPRQEDREPRDEARHAGGADPAARHPRLHRRLGDAALRGGQRRHRGPHGLSEILYAYTSAAGNNGSAFGGLSANTPWYNTTLGIAMLLGRFAYIVPVLAIAGSLAAKTRVPASAGTFPTDGPLFVGLLIGIILILGRPAVLPRARPGADRRAFPDARRPDLLRTNPMSKHAAIPHSCSIRRSCCRPCATPSSSSTRANWCAIR